jgi:lysozyme family protein
MKEYIREFLDKVKGYVVEWVLKVEREYLGEPGSVKREAVVNGVCALVDIPYVPAVIETPIKRALVGYLVDLAVEKLNWCTGYSFAEAEIAPETQTKLAAVIEAPVPTMAKSLAAASSSSSVDDRINALYEQYGIKPAVSEPEIVKEIPQQETTQAQIPVPAPAPKAEVSGAWDRILAFILKYEGGYVHDPDDSGGETNRGITKATLDAAYAQGLVGHNVVKNVTKEDASKIYAARYYLCYGYDKLPFPLALALTDTTVNCGRGGAAKIAQGALNALNYGLTVDGKWGPKTQSALDKAAADSPKRLAELVLSKRKDYYGAIITAKPSQEKFRKGWYNRIKALAAEAGVGSPV